MADIKSHARQLWQDFEDGNAAAFRKLHDLTYAELYRYGLRLVPRPALVRDALQETFVAVWQRKGQLPPVREPWLFLLTALRHKLFDLVRKEKEMAVEQPPVPSAEADLVEAELAAERRQWLANRLAGLPERQREALHLRYRVELAYPEIAEVLGVSQQVAYNYVNRGLKTLRKTLGEIPEDFFEK